MATVYRHNGPDVAMSLGSGRSLVPGATANIDVEATPEWSAARDWLRRGWLVPVEQHRAAQRPRVEELSECTVVELRALAEQHGIAVTTRCRKADLIDRLSHVGS